jgi:nicotinamide riboside kinase
MIVAISGAQSVGKTTVINELEKILGNKYTIVRESIRKLAKKGFIINEKGNDNTQIAVMNEHIKNLLPEGDLILDRSVLDGYIYTQYLFNNNKISEETLKYAESIFRDHINDIDILFYIKPEFEIVNDNVRSIDKEFRDAVVELFEKTIEDYNLDVIYLSGSVDERVNQFLDSIKEFKSNMIGI